MHARDLSLGMNFMIMCFIHIRIGEKTSMLYTKQLKFFHCHKPKHIHVHFDSEKFVLSIHVNSL